LYETKEDIQRETAVAAELCRAWKCQSRKFGKNYTLDYELLRDGSVVALCEIKCRNVDSNHYDTYMISLKKLHEARKIADSKKLPAFIVVHYEDDIKFIHVNEEPDKIEQGGRVDRNDPMDIEDVAHFNKERLASIYP
jgi:hypothetical protein